MPIKINSTGGGSVSIDVPSTGGTYTLTAPANNATIFTTDGGAITGNVSVAGVATFTSNVTFTSNNVSIGGQTASPFGAKNRLINGDMRIWQRNTTFSLPSGTITSANNYTSDRWMCYSGGSNPSHTVTRSTDVPSGFVYSLKNQRNNGVTATGTVYTVQFIESVNCYDLSGQTVTLSFWAKAGSNYSATSSLLTVTVGTGTTADQGYSVLSGAGWAGYATPLSTSASITTSWQKFTFTFALGSGIQEAFVMFGNSTTGTAGADDSYYVAGVQLESGAVATPFEFRQYGQELALCQRYYEVLTGDPGTAMLVHFQYAASNYWQYWYFKAQKRAAPTITKVNGTWTNGTPAIQPGLDAVSFNATVNAYLGGVNVGVVGLSASAEL